MKVRVVSGMALTPADKKRIEEFLRKKYAGCTFDYEVDEKVIGGFVAYAGDDIYDGSVSTMLAEIRKSIL